MVTEIQREGAKGDTFCMRILRLFHINSLRTAGYDRGGRVGTYPTCGGARCPRDSSPGLVERIPHWSVIGLVCAQGPDLAARQVAVQELLNEPCDSGSGIQLAIAPRVAEFRAYLLDRVPFQRAGSTRLELRDRRGDTCPPRAVRGITSNRRVTGAATAIENGLFLLAGRRSSRKIRR